MAKAHIRFNDGKARCGWLSEDPLYIDYHDREWGRPQHDDRMLFEMLILEGAQAGLSWITVLRKRENYRRAYDNFDAAKIARYDARKQAALLADPGIIRHPGKIEASIANARAFMRVVEREGSFDRFLWQFVDGKPIRNRFRLLRQIPAQTQHSTALSKALRAEGFNFVGPTICYAFMQAVGMTNDHLTGCFRHGKR
jgi:DNA-3-methyladenine glycosylase I